MRFQATALFKRLARKQLLEDLVVQHNETPPRTPATQSRILVAGLLAFAGYSFDEQKLWLKMVDEEDN